MLWSLAHGAWPVASRRPFHDVQVAALAFVVVVYMFGAGEGGGGRQERVVGAARVRDRASGD